MMALPFFRSNRKDAPESRSPRLDCSISTSGLLRYSVVNGLQHDIFLFTPLNRYENGWSLPAPGRLYVYWDDDETIHLSKRLWPVPPDVDVYAPEVPYVTVVDAGDRFAEEIQLPGALSLEVPYPLPAAVPVKKRSRRAIFSIGYFIPQNGKPAVHQVRVSRYEVMQVNYADAVQAQQLLQSEKMAVDLEISG